MNDEEDSDLDEDNIIEGDDDDLDEDEASDSEVDEEEVMILIQLRK